MKVNKYGHVLLGNDKKTQWFMNLPNQKRRTLDYNIGFRLPNVKQSAQSAKTPLKCWKLFFPDVCIEQIVKNTNIYLDKVRPNYEQESSVHPTDVQELHSFFGLLYIYDVNKIR